MQRVTALIVGAGQCGLAVSRRLSVRSIDHVLVERGEIGNSWRTERWDGLRLLTPNWQSHLGGRRYAGPDPDGFMSVPELVGLFERHAAEISAPIVTGTEVISVAPAASGFSVQTTAGAYRAEMVMLASGACNMPVVPAIAAALPGHVTQVSPHTYRRPSDLPPGRVLVVGASASGVQLAREIARSGRDVVLSAGEHIRVPRTCRGRDIMRWLDVIGAFDIDYREVDDLARVRRTPSLQLAGSDDRADVDFNALQDAGVEIVGRIMDIRDRKALLSGGLPNQCSLADQKMGRLIDTIDHWATEHHLDGVIAPPERPQATRLRQAPRLELDLNGIDAVVWATGFRPDYSWLHLPVFDRKGRLRHDGGVVDAPGLYAMGLPYMRKRKSTLIDGAADDARALAAHMFRRLDCRSAA